MAGQVEGDVGEEEGQYEGEDEGAGPFDGFFCSFFGFECFVPGGDDGGEYVVVELVQDFFFPFEGAEDSALAEFF